MTGVLVVPSTYHTFKSWFDFPVSLLTSDLQFGHMTHQANYVFLSLLARRSKGPIVEFGTFTGRGACNMALNSEQQVYTIDLGHSGDDYEYPAYVPGSDFIDLDIPNKPILIVGDSATVDIPVAPHSAGLVFIDGGHDYETVKSDSERAFRLVRPDGVILWDDYDIGWPGVVRYLHELAEAQPLVLFEQERFVAWGLI